MRNIEKDDDGIILHSVRYNRQGNCKHCGTPLILDQDHFGEVNMSEISGRTTGIFTRHAFLCESCYKDFYSKFREFFGYPAAIR